LNLDIEAAAIVAIEAAAPIFNVAIFFVPIAAAAAKAGFGIPGGKIAGIASVSAVTSAIAPVVLVIILPISKAFDIAKIMFANFSLSPANEDNKPKPD
jgi:hypothetical protein